MVEGENRSVFRFCDVLIRFRDTFSHRCLSYPQPGINYNRIPDVERPVRPTVNEIDIVRYRNEIPLLGNELGTKEENPSNVLMSQATGDSIFNKTEVLAGQWDACPTPSR